MATCWCADVLGQVEAFGGDAPGARRRPVRPGALEGRLDGLHRLVDRLAGGLLLLDGVEGAELPLEGGEFALLAEQSGVERSDRVQRFGLLDLGERCRLGGADVVDHGSPFKHDERTVWAVVIPGRTRVGARS
ncbi:MAG: hypothetical protein R2697_04535 [Ilumatobacteraceae bacterium]